MRRFWRKTEDVELERRLAAARPAPPDNFLAELVHRVESVPSEQRVTARPRGGTPRFALAGLVTASMVVVLAAFGGAGYAKSGVSHAAQSTGHSFTAVFKHGNGEHGDSNKNGDGEHGKHDDHHASHTTYPNPGFFCATKDSKVKIKLIITQERYDRLIARGWVVGPGPFASHNDAKNACLTAAAGHEDDDD
jgi:hypothetical protein